MDVLSKVMSIWQFSWNLVQKLTWKFHGLCTKNVQNGKNLKYIPVYEMKLYFSSFYLFNKVDFE